MAEEGRIWMGGLPERISEEAIRDEAKRFGRVEDVQIRFNTGKCSFAFVKYRTHQEAVDAIKGMDQGKLFGMPFIKVSWAGPRGSGPKGGGKGGRRSPRRSRSRSRRRSPSRRRSRSRSQRRRSPSRRRSRTPPRRRSPTPRRRSSSPKRRSPSPKRRSPSPKRRSPSPKRRSPSPRRRSPSARRSPEKRRSQSPPKRRSPSRPARDGSRKRNAESPPRSPRKPPKDVQESRNGRGEKRGKFCVVLENLPADMDSRELKEVGKDFGKVGELVSAKVISNRVGELEFTALEDMEAAIKKLNRRRFADSDDRLKAYEKGS